MTRVAAGLGADFAGSPAEAAPAGGLVLSNWRRAGATGPDALVRHDLRMEAGVIGERTPQYRPDEVVLDLEGAYLTPGLIDAHVHLGIGGPSPRGVVSGAAELDEHLRSTLAAGVTAVRNAGNVFDPAAGRRIAAAGMPGAFDAPRVVTAGRALTRRGCYGAFLGREIDTLEAGVRAVAEEIEAGATVIKLMLTGSVDFATGRVGRPHFDAGEVRALVAAAHVRGATVAAHANGAEAVGLAVEAGVDSVEHGILVGDRELSLLAERGTRWVPTLTPLYLLQGTAAWPQLPALFAAHMTAVARGRDLGVTIVAGTDSGSPGVAHNAIAVELRLLARAGLGPQEVAASTTAQAARLLGLSDGYGTLAAGARTDLVWFSRDPFVCRGEADSTAEPALPALGWVREGRLGVGAAGFKLL